MYHKYQIQRPHCWIKSWPIPIFRTSGYFYGLPLFGNSKHVRNKQPVRFFSFNCLFLCSGESCLRNIMKYHHQSWNHRISVLSFFHLWWWFYVSFQEKQGNNALTRAWFFLSCWLWIWNREWASQIVIYNDLCFFNDNSCYHHDPKKFATY